MYSPDKVCNLIRMAYDAPGNRVSWLAFLQRLGETMGTMANTVYIKQRPFRAEPDEIDIGSAGLDWAWYRSYHDYYGRKNPALLSCEHALTENSTYCDEALYPRPMLLKTEFYNDWIAPQKMEYALYGVVAKEQSRAILLNSVRAQGARPFAKEDSTLIQSILPHIRQAVRLHLKITGLQVQRRAAQEALNYWQLGVLLLDRNGRVLLMNRSAERTLSECDGIRIAIDGLHAALRPETAALRGLIGNAMKVSLGHTVEPGGVLPLSRPSGKRPLNVLVTPICSNVSLCPRPDAAAIVFVSDPETVEETREDFLARSFKLSPAEAGVAALLIQGKSVRAISEERHVSLNTLHTHLNRILEKTGTRRQTELIRLLLRSSACVVPSAEMFPRISTLKRSA